VSTTNIKKARKSLSRGKTGTKTRAFSHPNRQYKPVHFPELSALALRTTSDSLQRSTGSLFEFIELNEEKNTNE